MVGILGTEGIVAVGLDRGDPALIVTLDLEFLAVAFQALQVTVLIVDILIFVSPAVEDLLADIKLDADAFYPLSQAYSIPKDAPNRDEIMEKALLTASNAPMKIVEDVTKLVPVLEELEVIGSRLAISDVAVAAAACETALKGAVMNIYINTKSMKNREVADAMNEKAKALVSDGTKRCEAVYEKIAGGMI